VRPLRDWQADGIVGVFTDIDDTLTTEGVITPNALEALADLKAAGLHVIPSPDGLWAGASLLPKAGQ